MIFRRALLLTIVLLALLGLSACTRDRPPWTKEPAFIPLATVATPIPIGTPSGTILPRYTPHIVKPNLAPTDTPVPVIIATDTPVLPPPTPAAAPLQTGPTPTATLPPGYQRYTVKPGETLYDIAVKFDVPLESLARANLITDPTTIEAGQELIIPPR